MIVRCDKCKNTIDIKQYIFILAFINKEIPIKCKCGNEIYYKGE